MWLMPTRNRPDSVRELIASMKATGDVPTVAVMVDGPAYDIDWPSHWHVYQSSEHLEMQRALNILFEWHSDEPFYGIMADHVRPKTPDWANKLVEIAGNWRVSSSNCGKDRIHPTTGNRRLSLGCIGGDLVREIGWIWLPTVVHMYGDDAWEDIAYGLDIVTHAPDVHVVDLAKRDGEVPFDDNHKRIYKGKPYVENDRQAYIAWRRRMFEPLMKRLREKMCLPLPVS